MKLKELSNEELIQEFAHAVRDLLGSGAPGRARFFAAEAELNRRLGDVERLEKDRDYWKKDAQDWYKRHMEGGT